MTDIGASVPDRAGGPSDPSPSVSAKGAHPSRGMSDKRRWDDPVHDALNRMKRAHDRGTGCHLTAEMIAALGVTAWAQTWGEDDPRKAKP